VLDQLGNPGRIGVVGITPRNVVHMGRVEQPALHPVLEQVPDRLPVAPGRLHPHPGHPVAGQPLGQHIRSTVVVANGGSRRSAPWPSGTRTHGHRTLVHVQAGAALDQRLHLLASSRHANVRASPEEPLPGESQSRARGNSAGCPRPPRQTYQRARGTKQHQRRPDDQPISHPSRVAEHGRQTLVRDRQLSAVLSSLSAGRATPSVLQEWGARWP
jgi:hypothetical protein